MSARQKKRSGKNSDWQATLLILVIFIGCIAGYWFLNKPKEHPAPKNPPQPIVVHKPVIPVVQPVVKPVIKPVAKKPQVLPSGQGAKIAFVIDDWGYSTRNCAILKEIKDPLAVAILPNLKHSEDVESCARQANKNIMLHLPMQAYNNHDVYPDNYLLTTTMSPNKVEFILEDILKKMPSIEGVNNHMGSKAMEDKRLVRLVFRHLKKHNLFFVDSMTSPNHSWGLESANEYGLPFGQRDVFLDNTNTREAILRQFDELMKKAIKKGYAIAIGHDRTLTMQMIKEQAPTLKKQGFVIVSVKELLRNQ